MKARKGVTRKSDIYGPILERIFREKYRAGASEVTFTSGEIAAAAKALRLKPANRPDVLYSFRYRKPLPKSIQQSAPDNEYWVILGRGRGRYAFVLRRDSNFRPNLDLLETKIPDATPGIIAKYALTDEQALLAKLRYNRLIDIFTGITCYSLQSHLRTAVKDLGQIETDEVYIGLDKHGAHFVFPVQAKGGNDSLGTVQVEQDIQMCLEKFPGLICRPVGAQFVSSASIALFEFAAVEQGVKIASERHYRLVASDALSPEDLAQYSLSASK